MAWGKAGSTDVTSGDALTVSSISNNKSNMILYNAIPSGEMTEYMTMGNGSKDTGSNYANRKSTNGGAEGVYSSRSNIIFSAKSGGTQPELGVGYILNIATEEKLLIHHGVNASSSGAGTAPERIEVVGKWANTSDVMDVISCDNTGTGDYATGTNLSALGSDLTPAGTVPAVPAVDSVQDNSIFVETDTARRYWFDAESSVDATFTSDFSSSTGWTSTGSTPAVNTGTEKIDFEAATSANIKAQLTYDLTSTSDTKWTLRCKLNVTTFTQPTTEYHRFFIGLSSSTSSLNTSEDAIGLKYELGAGSLDRLVAIDTNGSAIRATTGDNFTHTSAVETLYVEIIRQSATTYDVNLRTGSHSGTLVEAKTGLTVSASTTGLQYLKIGSYSDNAGNGELSGTIDDVKFYNDITSVTTPATWTMQPTYEDNFSSDNWTDWGSGTPVSVDTTTGRLNFNLDGDNQQIDAGSQKDLTSISDTAFRLDFDYHMTTLTARTSGSAVIAYLGLSSIDHSGSNTDNTAQDWVGIYHKESNGNDGQDGGVANNTTLPTADGTIFDLTAGDTWYMRYVRDGNSMTITWYSDSARTTVQATKTLDVTNISGLRYFVVRNYYLSGTTPNCKVIGYIDNVTFYNGVTSP